MYRGGGGGGGWDEQSGSGEEEEQLDFGTWSGGHNEEGEREGTGVAIYPVSIEPELHDRYEGEMQNGKRHGEGVYTFGLMPGARYEGEYAEGKKRGKGTFYYPDGSVYEGSWVNDKREGRGVMTYKNGDVYDGEWRKGMRWGRGTYRYAAIGSEYEGQWVRGKRDGHGEFRHATHKYTGHYEGDAPLGVGVFSFDHGTRVHGEYGRVQVVKSNPDDSFGGGGGGSQYDDLEPVTRLQWKAVAYDTVEASATS